MLRAGYSWVVWTLLALWSLLAPVTMLVVTWGIAAAILQPLLGWPLAGFVAVAFGAASVYLYARQRANPTLIASVEIARPVADVFAFLARDFFENTGKRIGQDELVLSERTSSGPMAVGSSGRIVLLRDGKRIEQTWHVTTYEPNSIFAVRFSSTDDGRSAEVTYRFAPRARGTQLSSAYNLRVAMGWGLVVYMWSHSWRQQRQASLEAFKDAAEREIAPVEQPS